MKYQENIIQVATLQPDYLGFIFYEKSTRNFTATSIPKLPKTIKKTGVFVDADLDFVMKNIKQFDLQAVQLHGSESPEFCETLKTLCHSALDAESNTDKTKIKQIPASAGITEIIKAFSVHSDFNFDILKPYGAVCDYFLFDTKGKLPGGNGYTFDWSILNNYPSKKPFFLSGGIGTNEVESVLSFLGKEESEFCYAIDVNSKFETEPGLKNIELLKEFKNKLRVKS